MQKIETIFNYSIYLFYLLYFISLVGIFYVDPKYLTWINLFIRYFVLGFLLLRFHPFQKNIKFTDFDQKIVFSSALFLLATTSITDLVNTYLLELKNLFYSSFGFNSNRLSGPSFFNGLLFKS